MISKFNPIWPLKMLSTYCKFNVHCNTCLAAYSACTRAHRTWSASSPCFSLLWWSYPEKRINIKNKVFSLIINFLIFTTLQKKYIIQQKFCSATIIGTYFVILGMWTMSIYFLLICMSYKLNLLKSSIKKGTTWKRIKLIGYNNLLLF